MVGMPVGGPSQVSSPARRSRGRVLPIAKILNQYTCDTWRPLIGPCVAIPFAANKPCHMPTVHITSCHVSYGLPRVVRPTTSVHKTYGLYSQHPFFCLFVILNRMRYLSLPMSCLNPNELCWVRNDEAYTSPI
jgi:hypothetical protein